MFIPYQIGQEVYVFEKWTTADLKKWVIETISIYKTWAISFQISWMWSWWFNINEIYPCKWVAKQQLLEMWIARMSKILED